MYCDKCDYCVQNKSRMLIQVSKNVDRNEEQDKLNCKNNCLNYNYSLRTAQ
jgi:hypothetical protein